MCACEKQLKSDLPSEGSYVFTLKADASCIETKTDYTDAGVFSWLSGDCISVLFNNGTVEKFFTLSTTDSGSSASFSGTIEEGYSIGSISGDKWALYPASDNHTFNGTVPSFNIPNEINYTGEGKFYYANIPLYALGDADNTFAFKQLSPVFRFTFTGIPNDVTKVKLVVDNDGHQMTGNIALEPTSDSSMNGYYLKYSNSGSPKTVSYICNVKSDQSAVFYVPIRWWGTFKPTLTLYNASDNSVLITKTAQKATSDNNYARVKRITIPVTGEVWSYTSLYGIKWSEVSESASGVGNSDISAIKATSRDGFIYLYMEINESLLPLSSQNSDESMLQVYFGSGAVSGTGDWKWKNTGLKDDIEFCWLASEGSLSIHEDAEVGLFNEGTATTHGGTVYIEIKINKPTTGDYNYLSTDSNAYIGVVLFYNLGSNTSDWTNYRYAPTGGSMLTVPL